MLAGGRRADLADSSHKPAILKGTNKMRGLIAGWR